MGRKMGEFFVEVSGGRANVLELTGIASAAAVTLRSQGFREVLVGEPCLERTIPQTSLFRSNERIRAWQERRA